MVSNSVIADDRIAVSVDEIARVLPVSKSFVRLEIRRGHLRTTKVGRRRLILRSALFEWLQSGVEDTDTEQR